MSQQESSITETARPNRYKMSFHSIDRAGKTKESAYVIGVGGTTLPSVIEDFVEPVITNVEKFNTDLSTPIENKFTGVLPDDGYIYPSNDDADAMPVAVDEDTFRVFPAENEYKFVLSPDFIHVSDKWDAYTTIGKDELPEFPEVESDNLIDELLLNITFYDHNEPDGNDRVVREYFFTRFHDTDRIQLVSISNTDFTALRDRVDALPDSRNEDLYYELSDIACDIVNTDRKWSLYRIVDKSLLYTWNPDHRSIRSEPDETFESVTEPAFLFKYEPDGQLGTPTKHTGFTVLGDTRSETYRIDTPVPPKSSIHSELIKKCNTVTTTQELYHPDGVNATGKTVYRDIQTTITLPYEESPETETDAVMNITPDTPVRTVVSELLSNWKRYYNERVYDQLLCRAGLALPSGAVNSQATFEIKAEFEALSDLLTATKSDLQERTLLEDEEIKRLTQVIEEEK